MFGINSVVAFAADNKKALPKAEVVKQVSLFDHEHKVLDDLLGKYVANGAVDYAGLKTEMSKLENYIATIANLATSEYKKFSKKQRFAFWVNTYNAYTLRLILDYYPKIDSIRDIGKKLKLWDIFSGISQWKVTEYKLNSGVKREFKIMGTLRSLDNVEKVVLAKYKDARSHFAVNCAAISCPQLKSKVFLAKTLNKQLSKATREFLADTRFTKFDAAKNHLQLSMIFDWYKKDFEEFFKGGRLAFLKRYMPKEIGAKINDKTKITYMDYNWNLNKK